MREHTHQICLEQRGALPRHGRGILRSQDSGGKDQTKEDTSDRKFHRVEARTSRAIEMGGRIDDHIFPGGPKNGHSISASCFLRASLIFASAKPLNSAPLPCVSDVTRILESIERGDSGSAEALLPLVYDELRRLATARMAQEPAGQTLQPTALVHEAWLRLGGDAQPNWRNRAHFFAAAAEAMRRILIDRARRRAVRRASGLATPEELHESRIEARAGDDELLAVHEALDRLAEVDRSAAELVKLRYFVGMSLVEAAAGLGLPLRSAERLWAFSRSWLRDALRRSS
jgi:RNA polymerase sigma factor (TIGR02999 family)